MYLGNLYRTQRIGAFELGDDAAAAATKPKVKYLRSNKHGRFAKWLLKHPKFAKWLSRGASYKNKVVAVTPPPSATSISTPTPTPASTPTIHGYGDVTTGSSNYILYFLVILSLVGGGFFLYSRH